MTQHTFALITPTKTHYVDVTRPDGDERPWRDIVLEYSLEVGLIDPTDLDSASVLPAVRPAPPQAAWR